MCVRAGLYVVGFMVVASSPLVIPLLRLFYVVGFVSVAVEFPCYSLVIPLLFPCCSLVIPLLFPCCAWAGSGAGVCVWRLDLRISVKFAIFALPA